MDGMVECSHGGVITQNVESTSERAAFWGGGQEVLCLVKVVVENVTSPAVSGSELGEDVALEIFHGFGDPREVGGKLPGFEESFAMVRDFYKSLPWM